MKKFQYKAGFLKYFLIYFITFLKGLLAPFLFCVFCHVVYILAPRSEFWKCAKHANLFGFQVMLKQAFAAWNDALARGEEKTFHFCQSFNGCFLARPSDLGITAQGRNCE